MTLLRAPRRLLLALAGAVLVAAPAAAQQPTALKDIDVDRVVGIVGKHPILFSEVLEAINFARAQGLQLPPDTAGQMRIAREFLGRIIDKEVLLEAAKDYKIEVTESDVSSQVERDLDRARSNFRSDAEFRTALQREGFGTPEEYRKKAVEAAIKDETQRRTIDSLKAKGRLAPANVTEKEVQEAFDRLRRELPPRPAMVAFKQIIVALKPRAENIEKARAKIDSLRTLIEKGASFDSLARIHSEDLGSGAQGGDLDWQRRGAMVPEFERMMFALPPGRLSPIVETVYGFHIIRVDRVRAGEVRARHILIKPVVDSLDLAGSRERADTVLALWKNGTPFDSLVARYHDPDEERTIPDFPLDSLPAEYRVALRETPAGAFTPIFALPDRKSGLNKWAIAQVTAMKPAGEVTLADYQENIRKQLREEKSIRRTLDILRREIYVSLRL